MADGAPIKEIAAEAYLARLAERGVEYVFANAGTDFGPIIEALARANRKYPRFIVCPHENLAMGMAQGYYRISGKPAAVMVHVTVGTANALCGLMNASRDNIPILLAAGRSPWTETGHGASRNAWIHWAQESFDQGGMVREYVKWDYEAHAGQPIGAIVDRALDIAMSEPRGPVYLTLPREYLADPSVPLRRDTINTLGASAPEPARGAIEQAAEIIANAQFPLIVTSKAGRTIQGFTALSALAQEFALPVSQTQARDINIPSNHPMNLGLDLKPYLSKADAILVLDNEVPWMASRLQPRRDAKVIHLSADPLVMRYPFREMETDLAITGETSVALRVLGEALRIATRRQPHRIEERRAVVAKIQEERQANLEQMRQRLRAQTVINPAVISLYLNEVKSKDAIIVNELGVDAEMLEMTEFGSFLNSSPAGGLGRGLGAALGAKLAAPNRDVIVAVGDGSYMFGNPLPYHFVGRAENLPTLTIVNNNNAWHAVRATTLAIYPHGSASKVNKMPLVDLSPSPSFEKMTETCGGHGEKVETPTELLPALRRAMDAVRGGTPAILNVMTQP